MSRVGQWLTDRREERWQRDRDARYVAACLKAASPEPDQPPATWRQTVKQWVGTRSRQVQRVAVQGYQRAVQAGRVTARGVLAIQQAGHLPDHLTRRSARSVEIREPARPADAAWQHGYMQQIRQQAPGLTGPAVEPARTAADREPFAGYPVRIVRTPQVPETADPEAGQ